MLEQIHTHHLPAVAARDGADTPTTRLPLAQDGLQNLVDCLMARQPGSEYFNSTVTTSHIRLSWSDDSRVNRRRLLRTYRSRRAFHLAARRRGQASRDPRLVLLAVRDLDT